MHMAMTTRLHRERYAMHRKIQFQAIALKLDLLNKTSCTLLYFTKTKHDFFWPKKPWWICLNFKPSSPVLYVARKINLLHLIVNLEIDLARLYAQAV